MDVQYVQSNGRSGEDGEAELENNYRDNRRRNWDGFTFHGGRLWWIFSNIFSTNTFSKTSVSVEIFQIFFDALYPFQIVFCAILEVLTRDVRAEHFSVGWGKGKNMSALLISVQLWLGF